MKFFSTRMPKRFMSVLKKPWRRKLPDVYNSLSKRPDRIQTSKLSRVEYAGYYRYRIGDYRAIYFVDDELAQVFVVAIAHRSEAYDW
jgi:mRNA interferase RelE/StbE